MDDAVREAILVFDGPGEERWYDWVDQLDGLTIGFGQWPQAGFPDFLKDLRRPEHNNAFNAFVMRLSEYYGNHPEQWAKAPKASGPASSQAVADILNRTLYDKQFMARWKANCKKDCRQLCLPDSASFFRDNCDGPKDWIGSALKYALRDSEVVAWQVAYWKSFLIDKAQVDAKAVQLDGVPGMIAMASMRSSAVGYMQEFERQINTSGTLRRGGHTWSWVKPGNGSSSLTSWRLLVARQYYNSIKQKIRGRSQVFYDKYLSNDWILPGQTHGQPNWNDPRNNDPVLVRWAH